MRKQNKLKMKLCTFYSNYKVFMGIGFFRHNFSLWLNVHSINVIIKARGIKCSEFPKMKPDEING